MLELKKLRTENKKLARELKYEQMTNERNSIVFEAKDNLSRIISEEKNRLGLYMDLLLNNCPDLILFFSGESRLIFASESYVKISRAKTVGMIEGRSYEELLAPVVSPDFSGRVARLCRIALDERRIVEVEHDIDFSREGDERHYLMRVIPMLEDSGKTNGFVVFFLDSTEISRAQQEAERARFLAEQSTKAKSDFLSRMSHEMRTPMNAIIGMTTIARASNDPGRKEYCLEKISEASVHLLGVINDILDMSKIEANKFDLSESEFNFEKMLKRVTNVVNFRVEEKRQNLFVEMDNTIPENIVSDEQRLAQVITNLLSNAVKFTPDGGAVTLRTQKIASEGDACTIRITVEDTGIGISAEQQKKLFSLFEQADGSISRKFGGTGLGLAISKRIVELMGGNIWVESELGEGSAFIFEIKVKAADRTGYRVLPPDVNWGNLRVLAVDDSPEILEIFKAILLPYGVSCETALSGESALAMLERGAPIPFDVVFVDWKMPGLDGIDLCRRLKGVDASNLLVVMISAADFTEVENEAKSAGVDKFLQKPLFPSSIFNVINECMSGLALNQTSEGPDAASSDDGIFAGKRVLLAEDVAINSEILASLIEHTGVTLDIAEDGHVALEKFKSNPDGYDLILMDVHMPNMDGYEATRRIRALSVGKAKTIPIIAMTANVFREDIERCREAGMDDHLGKPIDAAEVISKMRKYIVTVRA
jgi:signal transduction histidine kinase/DNA-binding response OmpR family regulator